MNKAIHIDSTSYSPEVLLDSQGILTISGDSRLENPKNFYSDVLNKVEGNDIKLLSLYYEYVGSSNILSIVHLIHELLKEYKDLTIIWKHDVLDEDIQELGEIIKDSYNLKMTLEAIQ